MNENLQLTNDQLLGALNSMPLATAVYATENIIINHANDAMIAFWGKDRSVIGKSLDEALPEIKNQPFMAMLKAVMLTGITDAGKQFVPILWSGEYCKRSIMIMNTGQ